MSYNACRVDLWLEAIERGRSEARGYACASPCEPGLCAARDRRPDAWMRRAAARPAFAQDDDWSVAPNQTEPRQAESRQTDSHQIHQSNPAQAEPVAPQTPPPELQPAADGAQMICGEMARPAAEPYKSIVANIEREWGANAPVYESVRADSPHVSRGGCIFYNPIFMETFLRGETDEHGEPDKTSMIYAIMAHELGHIEHHDYERTQVSSVEKELEADRFSGYTLSRLGISHANITRLLQHGRRRVQRSPRPRLLQPAHRGVRHWLESAPNGTSPKAAARPGASPITRPLSTRARPTIRAPPQSVSTGYRCAGVCCLASSASGSR